MYFLVYYQLFCGTSTACLKVYDLTHIFPSKFPKPTWKIQVFKLPPPPPIFLGMMWRAVVGSKCEFRKGVVGFQPSHVLTLLGGSSQDLSVDRITSIYKLFRTFGRVTTLLHIRQSPGMVIKPVNRWDAISILAFDRAIPRVFIYSRA